MQIKMKSLKEKLRSGMKKVGSAALGVTMVAAPSIDAAAAEYVQEKSSVDKTEYSPSSEFDAKELAGMDFYSRPNIVSGWNYGNLDWNNFTREEKIDWVNTRFKDYQHLMSSNLDCEINTDIITLNFGGLANFENYVGFDRDGDGKKEGYDYYKNLVQNGIENLPVYSVGVVLNDESETTHAVP